MENYEHIFASLVTVVDSDDSVPVDVEGEPFSEFLSRLAHCFGLVFHPTNRSNMHATCL